MTRPLALPENQCQIDGCHKFVFARGWCQSHWKRWRAHGDPLAGRTPPGEPTRFLREVVFQYNSDDCLKWPYGHNGLGYGYINGIRPKYVHVLACMHANGPPPTNRHVAAHSCGNGHLGCVNPRHLRWATQAGNHADKIAHGTHGKGEKNSHAKLTEADAMAIKSLVGKEPQRSTAKRFGVSQTTVSDIRSGRRWPHLKITHD